MPAYKKAAKVIDLIDTKTGDYDLYPCFWEVKSIVQGHFESSQKGLWLQDETNPLIIQPHTFQGPHCLRQIVFT